MKKWSVFIWGMAILALIAICMLIKYFCQFAKNGWSDDPMEWGAFGSYMGAITGLLAFVGVLASIYNANKKSAEAKEEAEKVRKEAAEEDKKIREEAKIESEKLRDEARAKDERDLFFRLMEEHRQTRDTLIYPIENKKGIEAIGAYVDDINKDFQLLIILSSSFGHEKFRKWRAEINFKEQDEDTSKYRLMYEGLIIEVLECISVLPVLANPKKKVDLTKLHDENPEVKHATCEQCFSNLEELITIIEAGTLDTERFDYSKIPNASNLAFVARMIWRHLDNYGRCRALIYTGKIFHKKHLVPITYYFNNLAYTTYTLDNFVRTNKDYYMKYWRSKFSADEIYLLLFYLASDKLDVDILQTVIDYRLFDNLGTRDLVDLKQQDFRGTALAHELIKAIIEEKKEEKRRNEEK